MNLSNVFSQLYPYKCDYDDMVAGVRDNILTFDDIVGRLNEINAWLSVNVKAGHPVSQMVTCILT